MCDMFLEMTKSISISNTELKKRFVIKNPEELQRLEKQNKTVIVMFGHYASYEWSCVTENYISFKGFGVYKKIKNPYFDKLVQRIRRKYNTTLITSKETISTITENEANGIKGVIAFISDQSPKSVSKKHHWTSFFDIKVPCYTGAEILAKNLDLAITYLKIEKVKRGHYEAEFIPLADDAKAFNDYEITDKFHQILEAQIRKAPQYYLWTHKRWKHRIK